MIRAWFFLLCISCAFPLTNATLGFIENIPINLYAFLSLLSPLILLYQLSVRTREINKLIFGWIVLPLFVFVVYSVYSSFFFPEFFQGLPVFNPRKGIDSQVGNMDRLKYGVSNIAQSVYLILNLCTVINAIILNKTRELANTVKALYKILAFTIVFFAFWQLLAKGFSLYYPNEILYSIGDRGQFEQSILSVFRTNGSLREPSELGTFCGALAIGLYFLWLEEKRKRYALLLFLVILTALLSTSSLGLITVAVLITIFVINRLVNVIITRRLNLVFLLLVSVLSIFVFIIFLYTYQFVEVIFSSSLVNKLESNSANNRFFSDRHGIDLLFQTYGLGVGLGSNRPSSMIAYILSNIGVMGFLAFFTFVLGSYLVFKKYGNPITYYPFMAIVIIKCVAGPDLSTEYMWVMLFLFIANLNFKSQYAIELRKKVGILGK